MEKRKGFTLIELLAVIVILAIVAMITTPIVIGIIEESKERANRRSVDGLIRAGEVYLAQSLQDIDKASNIEQGRNLIQEIEYDGKRPEEGQIYVRPDGKIALAVQYDKKCYKKEYEGKIETLPYSMKNCKLNIHIEKPMVKITVPENMFNETGWSKENFIVTLEGVDYSGLGATLKWCGTENDSCEPSSIIDKSNGQIQISQETLGMKICAKAIDGFGNESEVICSKGYKLDKTAPTFTGLEEISISEKNPGDFLFGVVAEDNLSGVNGSITYNPTTFDMSHAYNTTAEYRVEDKAGNIGTATRNVRVGTEAPSVTFTPTAGSVNANGWAKENFYVAVGATDYSSTGIKEIHWCGTTSNTCEPSSSVSENLNAYIQTEGDNNRICAYAVDKYGGQGTTTCSDAYKLDKTAPTAGTFNASGTMGKNGWYISNISLSPVNGSDSLSGHASTTISHTSLTTDTAGTTVTITTTDLAGNSSIRQATYKLDKTAPTKPRVIAKYNNGSGATYTGSWTNQNVWVQVSSTDNLSGIAQYYQTKAYTRGEDLNFSGTITYTAEGTRSYHYRAEDQAGNSSEWTWPGTSDDWIGINIDRTAPTAPTTMNFVYGDWSRYNGGWTNRDVYIADTQSNPGPSGASDTLSGVSRYQISTDNINWQDYGYTAAGIYLLSTEGIHTRYFRTIDQAGNASGSISRTAYIDKTAPTAGTLNVSGTLGSNGWYTSNVTMSVNNGYDSLSGHASTSTNITSITYNTLGTNVTVTTRDNAGNTATRTYTVKVDKNAPTLTAKSGTFTIIQGENIAVSSYFNTPSYSISGGSWSCNPVNTSLLTVGSQTVTCTAIGGNGLSTTVSNIIKIKTLTPDFYVSYSGTINKYSYQNNRWDISNIENVSLGTTSPRSISTADENTFFFAYSGGIRKYTYQNGSWNVSTVRSMH